MRRRPIIAALLLGALLLAATVGCEESEGDRCRERCEEDHEACLEDPDKTPTWCDGERTNCLLGCESTE